MAKTTGRTRYRSLSSLQPWEVDGLHFHKQFPDIKVEKPVKEPRLTAVKSGVREIKTAAIDTVDSIKVAGLLTAVRAVNRYDEFVPKAKQKKQAINDKSYHLAERAVGRAYNMKDAASARLEKLRSRRERVADFITAKAGRKMMAQVASVERVKEPKIPAVPLRKVLGKPPKPAKQPKVKAPTAPKRPAVVPVGGMPTNPLSALLEKTQGRRPGPRTAGAAAVALAVLAASLASPNANNESLAQEVAIPEIVPERPVTANPVRPTSVMDSSITSTWSAPRTEERVVYNALPVPSINAVDYAANLAAQAKAEAMQQQYRAYEVARAQNRTSVPAPTTMLDTYVGWGEQAEINRLAAQAEAAAEMLRYQQERAALVGQLQPGQQIGTIRLVQTGESTEPGAPAGVNIVEHAVRVGVYDPSAIAGDVPTDREIDGGMKKALNYGAAIHMYGGSVPGIDAQQFAPTVIAMHHFTEVNDPAFPGETEAFRWPEKTTIADPENGIRGDTLTMTVGDQLMIYEAVGERLIDTTVEGRAEEAKYLFGTEEYGAEYLRLYNCAQSPEELAKAAPGTTPEADKRYVVFFEPRGTVNLNYLDTLGY